MNFGVCFKREVQVFVRLAQKVNMLMRLPVLSYLRELRFGQSQKFEYPQSQQIVSESLIAKIASFFT